MRREEGRGGKRGEEGRGERREVGRGTGGEEWYGWMGGFVILYVTMESFG